MTRGCEVRSLDSVYSGNLFLGACYEIPWAVCSSFIVLILGYLTVPYFKYHIVVECEKKSSSVGMF